MSQLLTRNASRNHVFENAKYKSAFNFILDDLLDKKLDKNYFPWIDEPPAAVESVLSPDFGQRRKPSWAMKKQAVVEEVVVRSNEARIILFVIGGVTHGELREVTTISKERRRDVMLGSTHIWSPDGFVQALKELGRKNVHGAKFDGFQRPEIIEAADSPKVIPLRDSRRREPRIANRTNSREERRSASTREERPSLTERLTKSATERTVDTRDGKRQESRRPEPNPSYRFKREGLTTEMDNLKIAPDGQKGQQSKWLARRAGLKKSDEPEEKKKGWFGF